VSVSHFQWVKDLQSELENDEYLQENKIGAVIGGAATAGAAVLGTLTAGAAVAAPAVATAEGVAAAGAVTMGAIAKQTLIMEVAEAAATVFAIPGAYIGASVERGIRWLFE
jgi:hypothetical protein